jgi:hypothetical protein
LWFCLLPEKMEQHVRDRTRLSNPMKRKNK